MRGPRASHRAASPRDRTAPQMASPLPAPPPPLIKQETDDEESPANGMSPDLPVKREDAAADDGDDEEAAGAVVKQEEGEGRLGREIVRTLVKGEVEEDAPDLKIVKVEEATEISDEAAADSRDGRLEAPDQNFVEVELSEEEDVGGDGAGDTTGGKRHGCPRCGKRFAHRYLLEIHVLSHTGERPHVCGDCGRGFVRLADLRKHTRTHAAAGGGVEKPYACGDCGRAFSHRYFLGIHARVHTGERPHACGVCGRTFAQRSHLEAHTRGYPPVPSAAGASHAAPTSVQSSKLIY
ncbi:zinc finger protein 500-like isoform X6 [Lethenteron reissneri]|uniref:zinc finger protein 500-like isoform X6 n=1 Tax=Lethenteron reissneri TaxID=7753 RepID=UPI002AB6BA98|nr:zinc finger protein 500-like isoform X6 [Lethenteron reissneri]